MHNSNCRNVQKHHIGEFYPLWVCLSDSFQNRGFYWQNKTINAVQVSNGMLQKYFCIKDLCLWIKDIHRKNLQAGNCAKECQINWEKPWEVKDNSHKLLKKQRKKVQSIDFFLTNLGSHPYSAQRHCCRTNTTPRGGRFY